MTDLADFLLARIAEDVAVAVAATDGPWRYDPNKIHVGDGEESVFTGPAGAEAVCVASTGPGDDPQSMMDALHIARWDPARVLAECEAKKAIVAWHTRKVELPEWTPDCGGDWCLNVGALSHEPGVGAFANYWPDNTVSASVYVDGKDVAKSGIVAHASKAECQAFAEHWIRDHLADASPVLRLLALPNADHPDWREEWRP